MCNGNRLIETIGFESVGEILAILDVALDESDITETCEWHCEVEDRWWALCGHQRNITDLYAVRWTKSYESGVADITIVDRYLARSDDVDDLRMWLHAIAGKFGKVKDVI